MRGRAFKLQMQEETGGVCVLLEFLHGQRVEVRAEVILAFIAQ